MLLNKTSLKQRAQEVQKEVQRLKDKYSKEINTFEGESFAENRASQEGMEESFERAESVVAQNKLLVVQIAVLKKKIEQLESKRVENKDFRKLSQKYQQANLQIQRLRSENQQLEIRLQEILRDCEELNRDRARLEARLDELHSRLRSPPDDALRNKISALQRNQSRLNQTIRTLNQRLQKYEEEASSSHYKFLKQEPGISQRNKDRQRVQRIQKERDRDFRQQSQYFYSPHLNPSGSYHQPTTRDAPIFHHTYNSRESQGSRDAHYSQQGSANKISTAVQPKKSTDKLMKQKNAPLSQLQSRPIINISSFLKDSRTPVKTQYSSPNSSLSSIKPKSSLGQSGLSSVYVSQAERTSSQYQFRKTQQGRRTEQKQFQSRVVNPQIGEYGRGGKGERRKRGGEERQQSDRDKRSETDNYNLRSQSARRY